MKSRAWQVLRSGILYFISFALYFITSIFMLGGDLDALYICIVLYVTSLFIALSPLGEWLLRLINNFRPVETKKEQQYLIPLFDEVKAQARSKSIKLPKRLKLYIKDTPTINAYAVGGHSICVTQGAIATLSEAELQALMLHEAGHIYYFHTRIQLLTLVGNGIFSVMVICTRLFQRVIEYFHKPFRNRNDMNILFAFVFSLASMLTEIMIFVLMFLFNVTLSISSRSNEYQADRFALECGYGDDLVSALYLIQKLSLSGDMKLVERMQASHPRVSKRIMKLEALLDQA